MSGTELSRVRTEFRLRLLEPINKSPLESNGAGVVMQSCGIWRTSISARIRAFIEFNSRAPLRAKADSIPPSLAVFAVPSLDSMYIRSIYCYYAEASEHFPRYGPRQEAGSHWKAQGLESLTTNPTCHLGVYRPRVSQAVKAPVGLVSSVLGVVLLVLMYAAMVSTMVWVVFQVVMFLVRMVHA
jgi:hypothetical protein